MGRPALLGEFTRLALRLRGVNRRLAELAEAVVRPCSGRKRGRAPATAVAVGAVVASMTDTGDSIGLAASPPPALNSMFGCR